MIVWFAQYAVAYSTRITFAISSKDFLLHYLISEILLPSPFMGEVLGDEGFFSGSIT
jgi:hypothetical protein